MLPNNAVEYCRELTTTTTTRSLRPAVTDNLQRDGTHRSRCDDVERCRHSRRCPCSPLRDVVVVATARALRLGTPQDTSRPLRAAGQPANTLAARQDPSRAGRCCSTPAMNLYFTRGTFRVGVTRSRSSRSMRNWAIPGRIFAMDIELLLLLPANPLTGRGRARGQEAFVFPATHYGYGGGPREPSDEPAIRAKSMRARRPGVAELDGQNSSRGPAGLRMPHSATTSNDAQGRLLLVASRTFAHSTVVERGSAPTADRQLLPRDFSLLSHRGVHVRSPAPAAIYRATCPRKRKPGRPRLPLPSALDNRPEVSRRSSHGSQRR